MPKLYVVPASPPVRSVLMCAKALSIDLEQHEISLVKREQFKPEFLKINPQHTIPTLLDDDGFIIWDSHAIMAYLVGKYGKNDALYPKDLKERAIVDQRLHFDSNVLFPRGGAISSSIIRHGAIKPKQEQEAQLLEAYDFVEKFLEGHDWIAGDNFTIADMSFVGTLTSWILLVPIDASKYMRISSWLKRVEKLPCYEANIPGLQKYELTVKSCLEKYQAQC